ncbi:MAG: hypothetical protein ACJ71N_13120 [Terriglobales bacterium]|jgi:hypothetical protein
MKAQLGIPITRGKSTRKSDLYLLLSLSLLAVLALQACTISAPQPKVELRNPPLPLPVGVRVSPNSTQLQTTTWIQFNAIVSNTTNTSVNWEVNGVSGGDGTNGTITSLGRYFAPNTLPANVSITVTAISNAEPSKSGTANVTLFERHRIAVRTVNGVGEFYDVVAGTQFVPRGNNYVRLGPETRVDGSATTYHTTFNVGAYDGARSEQALAEMQAFGYNVTRVWMNGCCVNVSIGNTSGGLNPAYVANLADFLSRAKSHGIQVILTADSTPDFGTYAQLLDQYCCATFANFNVHYLTRGGVQANQNFWRDLIQSLVSHNAPMDAVFAYQIREELSFDSNFPPFTLNTPVTTANGKEYDMSDPVARRQMMDDALVYWTDQVRSSIRAVDPSALVTVGFFAAQGPNPYRIGDPRLINPYPAIANSSADFVNLSAYPIAGELTMAQYAENFGFAGHLDKPVVLGEFGVLESQFTTKAQASSALVDWQVQSCGVGINGWILWTWDLTDSEQTDGPFWWATAGDGSIANNLSPSVRPNPCQ